MDFISPDSVLVWVVSLLFLFYWIFNFLILYHLERFGIGIQPKAFAAIFLLGAVALFSLSVLFFNNIDFSMLGDQFRVLINDSLNSVPKL